ncbi:MAG: glutamate--tRNA ligase [Gammaproteobacteria bacterium]|nr:glutamate--tRNA ligase [Gammaproteobacteria bacterium]MDP2141130.1 glutamate--tRNA ligase [Gammaproteobacteria bacterium]MDP2349195.1 glutamate--tRNA ligase [Gammaproteobacteria bacterium]
MQKVRTRIAPSPTGDPHVGTAYIALFNRCFAHQHGGEFILRIEDTDQLRSTAKSEKDILDALNWLGLSWSEGPDIGGRCAPYRQSQRSALYSSEILKLLDSGHAFPCFCTTDRLQELRTRQMENKISVGYDGHCLTLTEEQVAQKLSSGVEHVIRMRVPESGDCVFNDMLRGEIRINWQQIDMQVLIKSDGLPTYHFANVVDDHYMEISHVIRGEEWINSTPKHLLLYQYFGWETPIYCHMPLLRNTDKSKLSKRKNPTSIGYYRDMGYLPQAVVNYLGMMGWTMPDGSEMFSVEEMTTNFDLSRVSLGGPVFDIAKLDWLNGKYIRETLSDDDFLQQFANWAFRPDRVSGVIPLVKNRVERFSDVVPLAGFFLCGLPELNETSFDNKKVNMDECRKILQLTLWQLESLHEFNRTAIESSCVSIAAHLGIKIRDFLLPLFVAISGKEISTSVIDSISILGLDITRARIRHAINVLGGISNKEAKELEKDLRDFAQKTE